LTVLRVQLNPVRAVPGAVVAQASSPAGSGGVSPRESDSAAVLAAGRCGHPQPGRPRCQNSLKLHPVLPTSLFLLAGPDTPGVASPQHPGWENWKRGLDMKDYILKDKPEPAANDKFLTGLAFGPVLRVLVSG